MIGVVDVLIRDWRAGDGCEPREVAIILLTLASLDNCVTRARPSPRALPVMRMMDMVVLFDILEMR